VRILEEKVTIIATAAGEKNWGQKTLKVLPTWGVEIELGGGTEQDGTKPAPKDDNLYHEPWQQKEMLWRTNASWKNFFFASKLLEKP